MKLPPFEYACPTTVSEAVALLASHDGEAKALAGGQSLVPMMAFRVAQPSLLVDLRKLAELRDIKIAADGVTLGAMVRWREILDDERLRTAHPLLVAAVEHVAHYQIRNRGTVGGSIAHADPAAEMPGIAVTCEAKMTVVGKAGARVIEANDFFHGPLMTALKPTRSSPRSVCRPGRRSAASAFRNSPAAAATSRWRRRCCSTTKTAARRATPMSARSGSATRRCGLRRSKQVLNGSTIDEATIAKAEAAASAAVEPHDDIHASGAYRRALVGVMVERALRAAAA